MGVPKIRTPYFVNTFKDDKVMTQLMIQMDRKSLPHPSFIMFVKNHKKNIARYYNENNNLTPLLSSSTPQLRAVCPPNVNKTPSGRSDLITWLEGID